MLQGKDFPGRGTSPHEGPEQNVLARAGTGSKAALGQGSRVLGGFVCLWGAGEMRRALEGHPPWTVGVTEKQTSLVLSLENSGWICLNSD